MQGSGVVVFTANKVNGPWTRQAGHADINCQNASSLKCQTTRAVAGQQLERAIVPAQGFSINSIRTADGTVQHLWLGDRWLQGSKNNPNCTNVCSHPATAKQQARDCIAGQPEYRVGRDPMYWNPLEFETDGMLRQLRWRDSFELQLPD